MLPSCDQYSIVLHRVRHGDWGSDRWLGRQDIRRSKAANETIGIESIMIHADSVPIFGGALRRISRCLRSRWISRRNLAGDIRREVCGIRE
jgi:hypothetical protein